MVSLARIGRRYEVAFTIVEGGTGMVRGLMSEADQKQIPVYAFVNPRHILRTAVHTAVQAGMVLRSPIGAHFLVGDNGPSEQAEGPIWASFRLFETTGKYRWQRRMKVIDPVTKQQRDAGLEDMGMIWAAVEPLDREIGDFRMSASFEQARVITGRPIQHDDLIDGRKVTRAEKTLGVRLGTLT